MNGGARLRRALIQWIEIRAREDARPTRFMESPLSFFACIGTMNHPLTRPPGTLSPSEGERDGVRGRFMESLHSLLRTHWDHEPLCLTEARSGPRVCDPAPARVVGSLLSLFRRER